MKKYLLIFIIAVSIGLYFLYLQSTKTIVPKEAYEKLGDNKYVFVDVREKDEYQNGHIKGSVNFPSSSLENNYKKLPKNKTLILICRTHNRSSKAYKSLKDKGYKDLLVLKGGIVDWQKSGYELVKEENNNE